MKQYSLPSKNFSKKKKHPSLPLRQLINSISINESILKIEQSLDERKLSMPKEGFLIKTLH